MTENTARRVLREYRRSRAAMHEAVRVLHSLGIAQREICEISGLTRDGVRKIVSREREK